MFELLFYEMKMDLITEREELRAFKIVFIKSST